MQIETLRDVLHWTREFHLQMANCLQYSIDKNESERAKLLLKYLGEHEQRLVNVLAGFEKDTSESVLNTWCYEYLDKTPIVRHQQCEVPFSQLKSTDIIPEIINLHQQVIDLYNYLQSRAELPSTKELLTQLADLEQHKIMEMVQSANRLEDL
ncbi:MAG: ATPase [Moritella sp.]|uniref:ATPase n=1 Tax=Moritella sp. TaxID=78556 RepID=UPI0029A5D9A9|nr:ATPase [Moritella sp.]MDX2319391.1 ATPase [Moritella sp.]